jgi:hypothetical protein
MSLLVQHRILTELDFNELACLLSCQRNIRYQSTAMAMHGYSIDLADLFDFSTGKVSSSSQTAPLLEINPYFLFAFDFLSFLFRE